MAEQNAAEKELAARSRRQPAAAAPQVTTGADRERMQQQEQASIAQEAKDLKLDTWEDDEGKPVQPFYLAADGVTKLGPNGRELDEDGKEPPPRPGVDIT